MRLHEERNLGNVSEHGAVPVQRVRHRDGGAHLLRQAGAKLNVLESATLIGMLKGTSYYNPVLNPERALSGATWCWRRWSSAAS